MPASPSASTAAGSHIAMPQTERTRVGADRKAVQDTINRRRETRLPRPPSAPGRNRDSPAADHGADSTLGEPDRRCRKNMTTRAPPRTTDGRRQERLSGEDPRYQRAFATAEQAPIGPSSPLSVACPSAGDADRRIRTPNARRRTRIVLTCSSSRCLICSRCFLKSS